ncbi:MFS transporter [Microbacterium hydrocarbonoxydans]|uniref:MFS transporter n=1 Tax=Microbacterium hydrocarbonoxydans TaxID=273678 RepID=UPI00203F54BC|nr:MFS transporter [Microbacterium hydrocarbonoxydans]MCM3779731.1 MFS transporter [Microbacterium hydrocarbonoxydans]
MTEHAPGGAAGAPASATRYILRSRLLRGAFLSLVISGIGMSITAPQITLFLVEELHLTDSQAGLYFLTNLIAPVTGYIVGSLSDRLGSRLLVFRISAVAGFVGWALMAVAMQAWMPFAINLVLLSGAGAGAAQLQAAVRDELNRAPTPADNGVVAVMRTAMAFGWVVGPVLGAVLGATLGLRPLLFLTGLSILLSIVPLIGARVVPPRRGRESEIRMPQSDEALGEDAFEAEGDGPARATGVRTARRRSMIPLLLFTAIYVLIMCGETVKLAYLPLYMDRGLHVDAAIRGAIIGLQPLIELPLMLLAARLADRFGVTRVLMVGAAMAVGAHVSYASAAGIEPHIAPLIVGQLLMAGVIATFGVLGITVAQRLLPDRVGTASSVFLSAYAINAALGGFVGSVGAAWLGMPHLFWIPAGIAAIGGVALVVLGSLVPLGRPRG